MQAISGGLNPYVDIEAEKVACRLYEKIRGRKTDIENISRYTNFLLDQATIIKNYIL
jgi:hypothetical protein